MFSQFQVIKKVSSFPKLPICSQCTLSLPLENIREYRKCALGTRVKKNSKLKVFVQFVLSITKYCSIYYSINLAILTAKYWFMK